jgi:hypothetical protein
MRQRCGMRVLKTIATLMSLAVAGLGLLGVVAPDELLGFGSSLLAPPALYAVATARVVFGALLITVARSSRAPIALRVLGSFIFVAGLSTPFLGVERFGGVVASLSEKLWLVRMIAFVPLLLGLLLVYAINSKRKVAA